MFKCKECGTEYDVKPDYCDCGNDTFEEILPPEPPKTESEAPTTDNKNDMWVEENGLGYPINEESYNKMKEETKEIKETKVKNNIPTLQPYAIITFAICILLSLLIILFAFNPKNIEEQKTETKSETTDTQNIPAIEKLWNNSTEGISAYQNSGKTETKNEPQEQIKTEQIKEDNSKKKVEVKPQSAPAPAPVQKKQTPVQKTSVKTTQTTPQQVKKQQPQPVATPTKTASTKTTSTTSSVPKANPQELANYKIKLRNHIASKIAFASVVGDGECSFSFKISSSGVLTNKAPNKLSDNDSLNEAVYNALRQVYSYNAPPAGYKNETLKLIVKMYNNSFEVYLN